MVNIKGYQIQPFLTEPACRFTFDSYLGVESHVFASEEYDLM